MAGPYDPEGARVRVSTTTNGTYTDIGYVRTASATHGSEGLTRTKYLGGTLYKAGDLTDTYSVAFLLNLSDTNGQNIIRAAHDNGTTVFLQVLPEGTGSGALGYKQEVRVTEFTDSIDVDGEYVEGGFSAESVGTRTDITL